MKCLWHLCSNELIGRQRKFCGGKCKSKFFVTKYRRDIKQKLVEYKGGKCEKCGYDKCIAAMEFHHLDPNQKDFSLSEAGNCISLEEAKREVDKCELLCCRCHREKENDFIPR